jgi:hypothetical protein
MPIEIRMPTLSSSNDEGKLARWLVREGQRVKPGDVLAEIETEKAAIEIEAVDDGVITKLLVAAGTKGVKVNAPIALLEPSGGAGAGRQAPPSAPPQTPPSRPELSASRLVGSVPSATVNQGASAAPAPAIAASTAAIGRTRLMSSPTSAAPKDAKSGPPATAAGGAAKTQFLRAGVEPGQTDPVAGWVVVVKGPGRGGFRPVFIGMNSVGRDPSQRVALSFGDDSISREEHAFITYDEESRRFFLQHGGKSNLIRLGAQPVLLPTELKANDLIRIGRTTLRFVPCCGPEFSWGEESQTS